MENIESVLVNLGPLSLILVTFGVYALFVLGKAFWVIANYSVDFILIIAVVCLVILVKENHVHLRLADVALAVIGILVFLLVKKIRENHKRNSSGH